ncbi:restriction endonuclease subunit S [Helicobacter trogontum]|uniref:Restriction endonuclease subunit S n=1 Tax=Helicobacter trogontum TaxID=50960 RepID=A0A4V6I3B6_9HELI|nr:restriction endonuclease subunit S [Helicobacter trogontum]MDY5185429.1 restriction endonuclease subunit S [Helicobacter trogontum]TLD99372.1 restriction endonuclease subunit S [Helicobacter trogontum]
MRAFKDSGIEWLGEIPQDWNVVKGFFLFVNKKELNSNFQCKTRLALTLNGVIEKDIGQNFGLNPLDFRTYQIFNYDDLVFKLIDLDNINTSRVGYVYKKGIMSSAYIRLIPKEKSCSKYFYYFYYSLYVKQIFNNIGTGVRSTLNADELLSIKIPLPPLEEQKAIADFLDSKCAQIDNFCEKKQKLITLLNEKKQSLINECVTKGLDTNVTFKDSGVEYLGEIPQHWKLVRLGLILKTSSGTTPDSGNDKYYKGGQIVWINSGDLNDGFLKDSKRKITQDALDDYSVLKIFDKDSLIIAMYGATIGKTAILKVNACVNQACCVLEKSAWYNTFYLFYLFNRYKKELISMGSGGGQPNISQDIIKNLKIPLPPITEQEQIAQFLDSKISKIDKIIEKTKKQIKLIKEYKNTLINQAICGRINL